MHLIHDQTNPTNFKGVPVNLCCVLVSPRIPIPRCQKFGGARASASSVAPAPDMEDMGRNGSVKNICSYSQPLACNAGVSRACLYLGPVYVLFRSFGLGLAHCGLDLSLGLAGLVLCCETRSCHARHHNDLEEHSNFSSTVYSFSVLCLEHQYCGDQHVAFTYLKVKSDKCLCLLPVVLVLLFWSWS